MPITSTPIQSSSARRHNIIIGLLVPTLLFTIIAVALVVNVLNSRPSAADLAAACQSTVGATVQAGVNAIKATIATTAPTPEEKNIVVPAERLGVGFSYPSAGFSVVQEINDSESIIIIQPGIITRGGMGAPHSPINITITPKDSALKKAIDLQSYVRDLPSTNINTTITKNDNGTITQSQDDPRETIYFAGKDYLATVTFDLTGIDNKQEIQNLQDARKLIISTLDFSQIK